MDFITHDLRQAFRKLRSTPLFTFVAAVTLAVGIGAAVAVFSVVYGVLIKPLPFEEPEDLVAVWHTAPGIGFDLLNQSPALYFTYRDEAESFVESGMYDFDQVSITGRAEPQQLTAIRVTDGTFPLLGVETALGRLFTPEEDLPGTPETVILAHDYWREQLGGDPEVLGTTLIVDGRPREVVGVLREDFRFLDFDAELFLPFNFDRAEVFFGNFSYNGVARLAEGVTIEQANAELEGLLWTAIDTYGLPPGFERDMVDNVGFAPAVRDLKEDAVGDVGKVLWVLLGTVGLVLLIACANVANLFLVRGETRRQELATRSALGAGRRRLAGELLLESGLLGMLGGIVGLGLAWVGVEVLKGLAPRGLPRLEEIALDPVVLLFAIGATLFATLLFGALPALRLGALPIHEALKEGGRGSGASRERQRARDALVVVQVAMALVLLVASGLMVRSFQALRSVDPGFRDPEQVQTLRLTVPPAEVEDSVESARLHEEILRRLAALPGVESAGMSSSVTLDGWNSNDPVFFEDFPLKGQQVPPVRRFKWTSPNYHETMGNPLIAGRTLAWSDIYDVAPVAVVTESLARIHYDDPAEAVGRRIKPYPQTPWFTIIGVVGDIRDDGLDQPVTPTVYWPMVQQDFIGEGVSSQRSMAYVLRSDRVGSPGFLDEVRDAVWVVNPNLPLARVRTLAEIEERALARTSFTLTMLVIAALAAVLLGAVGIYGVTSYSVAQRSGEIGVRMALGARRSDVSGLVLRQGLLLAGIGVVLGVAAAAGLTRLMSALLFGVGALDPVTYIGVGVMVAAIALAASYLPARRAASVSPIEVLRNG